MTATTISDTERREVARRLRELPDDSTYPDLIGAIADHDGWYAAADAADRLADLIEPCCDRDALLALAEEMHAYSFHFSNGLQECTVQAWAQAIREALGASDD